MNKTQAGFAFCFLAFCATALYIWISIQNPQPLTVKNDPFGAAINEKKAPPPPPPAPPLALTAFEWSQEGDYVKVQGQVKNISDHPLEFVKATVTINDDGGKFVTTAEGYIKFYKNLNPGETSPFEMMEPWRPNMAKAAVDFDIKGEKVEYKNSL